MIYAYAVIAALIYGAGYMTAHGVYGVQLAELRSAVDEANLQAEVAMKRAQDRVAAATADAERVNQELEKSYEQNITTVNTYFDRLRNRAASRTNPVSSCESTGTLETPTAEFAETAYRIEAYAISCWRFVEDECGIRTKE